MNPAKRPPGLLCAGCVRRALTFNGASPSDDDIHVFQLKLRDWLAVERVELRPCLSVCPPAGVTVERRGKSMVLDQNAIDIVNGLFDPTRQLSLF